MAANFKSTPVPHLALALTRASDRESPRLKSSVGVLGTNSILITIIILLSQTSNLYAKAQVIIKKNTELKIHYLKKKASPHVGKAFPVEVSEDVLENNKVILPLSSKGEVLVTRLESQSKSKVIDAVGYIMLVNGDEIPLMMHEEIENPKNFSANNISSVIFAPFIFVGKRIYDYMFNPSGLPDKMYVSRDVLILDKAVPGTAQHLL